MCIVTNAGVNEHKLGYRCACNIGFRLAENEHNCVCKYNGTTFRL